MKVTLYMAISADGFIAKKDGDSDWVSETDSQIFEKMVKEYGCIVVGRTTFDQYLGELYPMKDVDNIVITTNSKRKSEQDNVIFTTKPAQAVVKLAKSRGHDKLLIVGGGKTNGLFLKAGLINEIYLSVHPLVLGNGIKLFEGVTTHLRLKLLEVKELKEDLVQLHYQVIKPQ